MKTYILILWLIIAGVAYGQDSAHNAGKGNIYGSEIEREHQDAIAVLNKNPLLCRLIGFKEIYVQRLSQYFQAQQLTLDATRNEAAGGTYVLSQNNLPGSAVRIEYKLNHDRRVVSVKIVGPFNPMAQMFINYWPYDPLWANANKLKPGITAIKHSFGDLVTFQFEPGTANITITSDPLVAIPLTTISRPSKRTINAKDLSRADSAYTRRKFLEAYSQYEKIAEEHPDNQYLLRRIAICKVNLYGKLSQGAELYALKALSLQPDDAVNKLYVGFVYKQLAKKEHSPDRRADYKQIAQRYLEEALAAGNPQAKTQLSELSGI